MTRTQSENASYPNWGSAAPHPRVESLEKRLKRVEETLSQLVADAAARRDISALLRDQAFHPPDTIPTGAEKLMAASPYLDADQAAAYLGITLSSLYGIVERRHLTPLRGPRRRYRFTRELLDEYLRRRRERE
jgi:excisionase family DNA binding protein